MGKYEWLLYVALAGLAWGTYVPIIFFGGSELTVTGPDRPPTPSGRFMSILCVGGAYFVIGVLLPLLMFATGWLGVKWSDVNFGATGLTFASLAGVAGAVGAICVIFATSAAVAAGKGLVPPNPNAYKIYIAPLIFGLAPVINVLVSIIWHPKTGSAFHFGIEHLPGWKLWVGIVLVGVGAALVLLSKEEAEVPQPRAQATPAVVAAAPESPQVAPEAKP
ncbi:MAG TPA: hypothetical protein VKA46_11045 [Gemmataceae bacterium]|nr:hypothetical protein [Gemmataceae bacterium]